MKPIRWDKDKLVLLDQRKLPDEIRYVKCFTADDIFNAIKKMVVRGAPAIGVTAAYGLALAAKECKKNNGINDYEYVKKVAEELGQARPTAVNLSWALSKMVTLAQNCDPAELFNVLIKGAQDIHRADLDDNQKMGKIGAELIKGESNILTHCNAGALATSGYGTALGVVRKAFENGCIKKIYTTETRPWFQGSRLTASELLHDGLGVIIIVDSASGFLMKSKKIDWIIVGADRISANGDVINKIGTYSLAVLAEKHDVKFMVVAPTSSLDLNTASGLDVTIEQRHENEVKYYNNQLIAPKEAKVFNPVFDVTPNELVDVLVTEQGAILHPDKKKLRQLVSARNV